MWSDYLWTTTYEGVGLLEGSVVSVARGPSVQQALSRFEADSVAELSFDEFFPSARDAFTPSGVTVGLFEVEGCVVMFAPRGAGSPDLVNSSLGKGSCVAMSQSSRGQSSFSWFEDDELKTFFEVPFSWFREGSDPDGLLSAMRSVGGFWFYDGDLEDGDPEIPDNQHVYEARFALCEAVVDVRITPDLLANATYLAPILGAR